MNDVVQNDQIFAYNTMNVEAIRAIPDLESAKLCVARLAGFQKALEEANRFFEMAVAFAELEAAALIRVMELTNGDQRAVRGERGKAAQWLWRMSEEQRKETIQMCKEGLTLTQVWRREVKYKGEIPQSAQAKKIQERKQMYIAEAEEVGVVDISDFSLGDESHHQMTQYLWADAKQGLRRSLLRSGFVGVGNDLQIYVNPLQSNENQIRMAITTRLESIMNDINNVHDIATAANIAIPNIFLLTNTAEQALKMFKEEGVKIWQKSSE